MVRLKRRIAASKGSFSLRRILGMCVTPLRADLLSRGVRCLFLYFYFQTQAARCVERYYMAYCYF